MKSAVLLIALIAAASAVPQRQQRIVGGEPTTIQNYPFMTSMHYLWWGFIWSQSCGGALLTSTTVLSAAHCYHGDSASSWRVQVGSHFPSSGGTTVNVARLNNHAGYNPVTLDNDVAIVHLASAVPLALNNIATARIAGSNYNLPDHTSIWAVGFGTLSSGGPSPDQLHHVEVRTINWDLCAERYASLKAQPGYHNWPEVTPGMACAGILDVGGADACQGDSGGPVVHAGDVVYGVTSWGFGCAHNFYPGVNAHVPFYSQWIVDNGST